MLNIVTEARGTFTETDMSECLTADLVTNYFNDLIKEYGTYGIYILICPELEWTLLRVLENPEVPKNQITYDKYDFLPRGVWLMSNGIRTIIFSHKDSIPCPVK